MSKKHGVYSVCLSICVNRENLFFSFFLKFVGVLTLFAGPLCVGGVWVEVGHQGKEFNKSCRKRSGSAISVRRPARRTGSQVSYQHLNSHQARK